MVLSSSIWGISLEGDKHPICSANSFKACTFPQCVLFDTRYFRALWGKLARCFKARLKGVCQSTDQLIVSPQGFQTLPVCRSTQKKKDTQTVESCWPLAHAWQESINRLGNYETVVEVCQTQVALKLSKFTFWKKKEKSRPWGAFHTHKRLSFQWHYSSHSKSLFLSRSSQLVFSFMNLGDLAFFFPFSQIDLSAGKLIVQACVRLPGREWMWASRGQRSPWHVFLWCWNGERPWESVEHTDEWGLRWGT